MADSTSNAGIPRLRLGMTSWLSCHPDQRRSNIPCFPVWKTGKQEEAVIPNARALPERRDRFVPLIALRYHGWQYIERRDASPPARHDKLCSHIIPTGSRSILPYFPAEKTGEAGGGCSSELIIRAGAAEPNAAYPVATVSRDVIVAI